MVVPALALLVGCDQVSRDREGWVLRLGSEEAQEEKDPDAWLKDEQNMSDEHVDAALVPDRGPPDQRRSLYPSLMEDSTPKVAAQQTSSAPDPGQVHSTIQMGEEEIRILDPNMGSVQAEDVKKLRKD